MKLAEPAVQEANDTKQEGDDIKQEPDIKQETDIKQEAGSKQEADIKEDPDPRTPNICRSCCLRLQLNLQTATLQTKEHFIKLLQDPVQVPPSFALLPDDTPSVEQLRTLPHSTCYLCAGILQKYTLQHILAKCQDLLAEYECNGGVGVTCSSLALLLTRSYLCGLGKLNLGVKTVFKWLMADGLRGLGFTCAAGSGGEINIIINVAIKLDNEEYMWMCRDPVNWNVYNYVQGKFKAAQVESALAASSHDHIKSYLKLPGRAIQLAMSIETCQIFLGGRYTKHARNISQTPWFAQDGLLIADNIEDIITKPIKEALGADEVKMHAAGREDIDVRMLGSGRPFYIQLSNVRRLPTQSLLDQLQQDINTRSKHVKCYKLTPITRAQTEIVKQGQEEKEKEYRCIVKAEGEVTSAMIEKLNKIQDLVLDQKTPIRVLHRRTPLTRKKRILRVSARILTPQEVEVAAQHDPQLTEKLANRLFVARVVSEAGTYIKEFVHGDFNRTTPNIGIIIENRCDMLQLDVTNLQMVWPPEPEPEPAKIEATS